MNYAEVKEIVSRPARIQLIVTFVTASIFMLYLLNRFTASFSFVDDYDANHILIVFVVFFATFQLSWNISKGRVLRVLLDDEIIQNDKITATSSLSLKLIRFSAD